MNWLMDWIREGRELRIQSEQTRQEIAESLVKLREGRSGTDAYKRGRRDALHEVAAECSLESENPRYVVVQMSKDTYLELMSTLGDPNG